jgi:8-oxo-dGTP diphosphatase
MRHRISAGALIVHEGQLLLARHLKLGRYDFWAGPGGGVEGNEELHEAAEREAFEETGLRVRAHTLAYVDELIDGNGRMVKFWFVADLVSGTIDLGNNPALTESIVDAQWFDRNTLPNGHVFPEVSRDRFWADLETGFAAPIKLPLRHSIF